MWHKRRALVGTLVILLLETPGCGDNGSEPLTDALSYAAVAGKWSGIVSETVPDTSYLTTLTLMREAEAGGKIGSIDYTVLQCGGDLFALHAADPVYRVSEGLTYGSDRCTRGVPSP